MSSLNGFKTTQISHALCAILILHTICHLQLVKCQDGDAEFEAVHQDIGRISGLGAQGSPQVAPKSALIVRQPAPAAAHEASQLISPPANVAQVFEARASPRAGASRKAQRITLVARRDPLPATLTTAPAQPSLIAAQLPAPPQQLQPALAAHEAPAYTPSFGSLPPAAPSAAATASQPHYDSLAGTSTSTSTTVAAAGPALSSFRSAASVAAPAHHFVQAAPGAVALGAEHGSVSARHSALMAQVAAERAAAASLIGSEPASSAVAPLGLAPAEPHPLPVPRHSHAQHQHHQQQHHQQQQQQPAAIAFTGALPAASTAQGHALLGGSSSGLEEPLVAPSFEHVLGHGCPHKGVFSWENKDFCDRYYMCTNGTFTEEACPNGLAYSQQGAVYQHCAYNWNVECGRKKSAEPIASPGCPWQFGLFPIVQNGRCSIDYFACEWGVPETKRCSPEGLFYDDRIKGCQWADQLGCKSEALLNFKCPAEDEDNPYWPYPRYYHTAQDVIVCVNEQPRLVHCNEEQLVEPSSLACVDVKPKKKKF